eukprot:Pompholyxophrys_punicea_v1_NODE_575_length_1667_cov_11.192808.p2 type:complete len:116 gc:universal NODE_575_length_1667_cov_11.192808:1134-1481(+)
MKMSMVCITSSQPLPPSTPAHAVGSGCMLCRLVQTFRLYQKEGLGKPAESNFSFASKIVRFSPQCWISDAEEKSSPSKKRFLSREGLQSTFCVPEFVKHNGHALYFLEGRGTLGL